MRFAWESRNLLSETWQNSRLFAAASTNSTDFVLQHRSLSNPIRFHQQWLKQSTREKVAPTRVYLQKLGFPSTTC